MMWTRLLPFFIFVSFFFFGCAHSLNSVSFLSKSKSHTKSDIVIPEKVPDPLSKNLPQNNSDFENQSINLQGKDNISENSEPDISSEQKIQTLFDDALEFCQTSQEFWQKGDFDSALEALDQAYELILSANTEDASGYMQQKEDIRFMISKRILEIYASRNTIIKGKYNAIPIVLNKYTKNEINLFTKGGEKRFFIESYKRSGRYRAQIVADLKAAGLPEELSWLPLIESGFKVQALSKARALGLWQFIPSTGYKFGLKRDTYVDERLDPVKATKAAISYLKELHHIFGDWATVLAAYNCGEGRVLRVIRSQNVNYLDNFWDLYQKLPRETARYVPRFLATLHIINNLEKYGLDQIEIDPPMEYETVMVKKQFLLKDASVKIGLHGKKLESLNPELRHKVIPAKEYELKIPLGKSELLLSKIDDIPETRLIKRNYTKHRVRHGETLSTIARRYRTTIRKIAAANNIRKFSYIVAGKVIKIPQRGGACLFTSKKQGVQTAVSDQLTTHITKPGDSLWTIARSYGTTVNKIKVLNNLSGNYLRVGQVLKIPVVKKAQMV